MKCTNCNSENIEFIESYKKANPIFFIIVTILLVILLIIAIIRLDLRVIILSSTLIAITIIIYIITNIIISHKTRTKAICRDCGNIWYLD